MYCKRYHFDQPPFSVTPDPSFLLLTPQHMEALSIMKFGIENRKGFVVITGEVGTGKTTLIKALASELDPTSSMALVFNPRLDFPALMRTILVDLGLSPTGDKDELISRLNTFALEELARGRNVVIIIDEAQNLGVDTMEEIRLLTNLETDKEKLIQLFLIGQPGLSDLLDHPDLEQVKQRVTHRFHLKALNRDETGQYIDHRLAQAGPDTPVSFSDKALELLWKHSGGVPRIINVIADNALICSFARDSDQVEKKDVIEAASDLGHLQGAASNSGDNLIKAIENNSFVKVLQNTELKRVFLNIIALLLVVFMIPVLYWGFSYFRLEMSQASLKASIEAEHKALELEKLKQQREQAALEAEKAAQKTLESRLSGERELAALEAENRRIADYTVETERLQSARAEVEAEKTQAKKVMAEAEQARKKIEEERIRLAKIESEKNLSLKQEYERNLEEVKRITRELEEERKKAALAAADAEKARKTAEAEAERVRSAQLTLESAQLTLEKEKARIAEEAKKIREAQAEAEAERIRSVQLTGEKEKARIAEEEKRIREAQEAAEAERIRSAQLILEKEETVVVPQISDTEQVLEWRAQKGVMTSVEVPSDDVIFDDEPLKTDTEISVRKGKEYWFLRPSRIRQGWYRLTLEFGEGKPVVEYKSQTIPMVRESKGFYSIRMGVGQGAEDGLSSFRIIIQDKDGNSLFKSVNMIIDHMPPGVAAEFKPQPVKKGSELFMRVRADSDTSRIKATMPWGTKVDIKYDRKEEISLASLRIPGSAETGTNEVKLTAVDFAGNTSIIMEKILIE